MATLLYEDTLTNDLKTFKEVKEDYMESVGAELPIDDTTMSLIILTKLVQEDGSISIVRDSILDWCNDYADYKEADRFLSKDERDESIKDIYECISCRGDYIEEIRKELVDDEEGRNLLVRLEKLI